MREAHAWTGPLPQLVRGASHPPIKTTFSPEVKCVQETDRAAEVHFDLYGLHDL